MPKTFRTASLCAAGLATLVAACATIDGQRDDLPVVDETWMSVATPEDVVDSVAGWRTAEGKRLVLATAKGGHTLRFYDGDTGRFLRSLGSHGEGAGQLAHPNGVFVVDDLAMVVERDNRRVQVFDLGTSDSLGSFGSEHLRAPYGLWVLAGTEGSYRVYVTDSYYSADNQVPPDDQLGERVKLYQVDIDVAHGRIEGRLLRSFGATSGPGRLLRVESIWGDPAHDRLLVADEHAEQQDIKVYDLAGDFTGEVIGTGEFRHEPEGIALIECDATEGYWLVSDQGESQVFRLYDRRSLAPLRGFVPARTHTVDGIWFQPGDWGPFRSGALFSQHADAAVAAFDWTTIAAATGLRSDCGR